MIPEIVADTEHKMKGAVEHLREEFAGIRTGRAHPAMFSKILVDYYGAPTPLQSLATFQVQEGRTVIITPFDRGATKGIEKSIRDSDLGVNPSNDGATIRLVLPPLSEERRKEYIKVTKHKAEEARIAVRNTRRHSNEAVHKLLKDKEIGEDDSTRAEKQLDGITKKYTDQVDEILKAKEVELLEV